VNCESDFVARTDDFKELPARHLQAHCLPGDPKCVRREAVTPEASSAKVYLSRPAAATGSRRNVVEKIVEGKMAKFYEECLLEQPFTRTKTTPISQLVAPRVGNTGRNTVRRFGRLKSAMRTPTVAFTPHHTGAD